MPKPQRHAAGDDPVRLTLSIGSTHYDVRPFLGAIELIGPDRRAYIVHRADATTIECTCPDYGYRAALEGRRCKHGRAIEAIGLGPCLTIPPEAPDAEIPQD